MAIINGFQQRQFLNAHRLFGVRNILSIIGHLDPVQRGEAMRSIIFQSNARAHDPVGGCCRIILELERQIERDSAELALVLRQLAICRAQAQAAALSPATTDVSVNPNLILSTGDDAGGNAIYSGHENGLLLPPMQQQQQPQQQYYDYFYYDGGGGGDNPNNSDSNNNSISNSHSINGNHHHRYNNSGLEMEVPTSSMLSLHPQQRCKVDEEAVKPLVDMFEVRQPIMIGDEEEEEEESANNFAATVTETFQFSSKI